MCWNKSNYSFKSIVNISGPVYSALEGQAKLQRTMCCYVDNIGQCALTVLI